MRGGASGERADNYGEMGPNGTVTNGKPQRSGDLPSGKTMTGPPLRFAFFCRHLVIAVAIAAVQSETPPPPQTKSSPSLARPRLLRCFAPHSITHSSDGTLARSHPLCGFPSLATMAGLKISLASRSSCFLGLLVGSWWAWWWDRASGTKKDTGSAIRTGFFSCWG